MGVHRSSPHPTIQKKEKMRRRILVIGGLAAGPSAASKAKRTDPEADVVLFEQGEYISYGVCEIPYLISNEISDAKHLVIYSPERLEKEKGVVAKTFHLVEEIHPSRKEIRVRNLNGGSHTTEHYDKLIIATGSTPKTLVLEGIDSRNVFTVKALDAAYAMKRYLDEEKPRRGVIIGGGFIGLEMADALVRRDIEVTMLHNGAQPMSKLEEEGRAIVLAEILAHGVQFIPNAKVEWLGVGAKGNVVAVGTSGGTIETDIVIVAIGVAPNAALAKAAGIQCGNLGGICVSDTMRTLGAENIFAAGDCCELRDIISKKPMYLSLATIATKTGWVAGENAVGGKSVFKGTMRAIGVRVFDKEIAHVGLSLKEAKGFYFDAVTQTIRAQSKVGMMPGVQDITFTVIADRKTGRVLGANVIGNEGAILRANTLAVAIRHGMTVADLSEFDLIYTPPFAPLWDGINIIGNQMKKKI